MNTAVLPGDGIAITLDKPRVMRLNMSAFRLIKRETQQSPFSQDFWADFGTENLEKVSVVFWAALRHEDPALTHEAADALGDAMSFRDLMRTVNECVQASMPAPKSE